MLKLTPEFREKIIRPFYNRKMQTPVQPHILSWTYAKEALAFPVIVCCSAMSMVTIYACLAMEIGLHLQPNNFLPLVVGIAGAVAGPMTVFAFFREHKKYASHLELQNFATIDPLTGVLNRRAFRSAVNDEQLRMTRTDSSAAVLLFDLDRFKILNDIYGHSVGDEVLKSVSAVAHSELRGPFDRLGRWGGEEFIILLNDITAVQAHAVAQRLRLRIQSERIEINGVSVGVTASFGIASISANDCFDGAVSRADAGLYEAKANGRNQVVDKSPVELVA